MTLESETSDIVGIGNEDMDMPTLNASEDSSDDESYDENDNSDSSDDDDDILIGAVNVKDLNMRQYGKPKSTAYSVENMITAVKIIYQQELGVVKCLASRKDKAKKLILPQRKVEFSRQDSVAKGVRLGKTIISSSDYFMDSTKEDPVHAIAKDFVPAIDDMFKLSWARRQGHGKMSGIRYVKTYQKDLEAMFEEGKKDPSKKMNPGKMRERLVRKYPNNFSIPGETEIKQFIGSQNQKEKYHEKKNNEGIQSDNRGRKPGLKMVWKTLLEPFVISRQTTKNAILFDEFMASLGNVESWPKDLPRNAENTDTADKKKVTSAISNIKQKLKKNAKRALLA